jgi:uncharacterized protein (DUF885 family)
VNEASAAARELADRYWADLLELEPLIGTSAGDERYDDRLPDPSETGRARADRVHRTAVADIDGVDRSSLDFISRTTLDVMEAIAARGISALEHRIDRLSAMSHLWGPGQLLAELGSLQRADTSERLDRYVSRLQAIPAYLEAIEEVAEEGIRTGVTSPALVVDRTIGQVERLLAVAPEDSPALVPVPEGDGEGRDRVAATLRAAVLPAYETYLAKARAYRPHATQTIGLHALPGGDQMYAAEILAWTSLSMPAKEIHDVGLESFRAIVEERRRIAEGLGYPDAATAVAEHEASGRNTAPSREAMVRLAEEQVRRGWEAAPRFFGRLPTANCEVRKVEEFREKDMPFAFYQSPTEDGSRPGVYFVNTSDLEKRPLHHLASTTYHESNPGHHFQISLEQQFQERPALRRFGGLLAGSAFIEGWGLYSERLAEEMGLYQDEFERIGMLEAQAWRAARLVVDTGIHAFGWDRERCIAFLKEGGVPQLEAEIETDRYIALPGQALAYMIGQLEIQRARAAAEDREGESFSLRDFHDRVLSLGSIPLMSLRRELESEPKD